MAQKVAICDLVVKAWVEICRIVIEAERELEYAESDDEDYEDDEDHEASTMAQKAAARDLIVKATVKTCEKIIGAVRQLEYDESDDEDDKRVLDITRSKTYGNRLLFPKKEDSKDQS